MVYNNYNKYTTCVQNVLRGISIGTSKNKIHPYFDYYRYFLSQKYIRKYKFCKKNLQ